MPDFRSLLSKPAGKSVKPPQLPAGDYPGIVKKFELGESSKKKTPYVRFPAALMGWPEGAEPLPGVDLAKRQAHVDFYMTEAAQWRLDDFIKSCGVDMEGRTYEDVLPEIVGKSVIVHMIQEPSEDGTEVFSKAKGMVGTGG